MCVCVHHINRSGPNLMIIHPEKQNAVVDPVRGLLDRREKGTKKRSHPGVQIAKTNTKTITPRKRNKKYPIQWTPPRKTKQKQKHEASEMIIDANDRER